MALHSAIDDNRRADKAAALLAIVGLVCVPVIFWSINCPDPNQCAALHQRSSMSKMDPNILWAMLTVTLGFWCYSFATAFTRIRTIILSRESDAGWVREMLEAER
jgi:heme exporter protein C